MNLLLYYHTIRYLKWKQILFQLHYRIRKKIRTLRGFSYPLSVYSQGQPLSLQNFIPKYVSKKTCNHFTFLNQETKFTHWNDEQFGKLWTYNLNYMDYLLQPIIAFEEGKQWINKFIADIHTNKNLDPYPIALRGINWIKFISLHRQEISEQEKGNWDASLYAQYRILSDNLEYHLLGNHLLEDAYSLFFAGLYFKEKKWYQKSRELLFQELNEQILPDGGHFELSPMYHAILLDRLLDCINVSNNNIRFDKQEDTTRFLEQKATVMLGWLKAIIYKDGSLPLVNDSANGISPVSSDIFEYARRLGLQWKKNSLKESGYRKLETLNTEVFIDIGNIGVNYQPGHTHADTFNFELKIHNNPIIIDTGISTYEKNSRRQYERGTKAHNTVVIDAKDSSQTWDAFRVGKRAFVTITKEENYLIKAFHNGFGKTKHERVFKVEEKQLIIKDTLSSKTEKGLGFIILHPEIQLISIENKSIQTNTISIFFENVTDIQVADCEVAFEYNRLIRTKKICYSFYEYSLFNILFRT